jgi:hypothetical protein
VTTPDRKQRIRDYKTTPRPMGVFRVRNVPMRRSFLGSSADLPGILNRHRFQLELGSHANRALQADWNALGPDGFAFDVLDRLEPRDEPAYDPREDLAVLREIWAEKLVASGESLY